jgi:uncharacterized protein YukE
MVCCYPQNWQRLQEARLLIAQTRSKFDWRMAGKAFEVQQRAMQQAAATMVRLLMPCTSEVAHITDCLIANLQSRLDQDFARELQQWETDMDKKDAQLKSTKHVIQVSLASASAQKLC